MQATTSTDWIVLSPVHTRGEAASSAGQSSEGAASLARRPVPTASGASPTASPSSGSESGDLEYHLQRMGVHDHMRWGRALRHAGYADMDDLAAKADEELLALAAEILMPSGIKDKFIAGMTAFKRKDGTFDAKFSLPAGDLDATAPRQTQAKFMDAIMWGIAGVLAVVFFVGLGYYTGAARIVAAAASSGLGSLMAGVLAVTSDCLDGEAEITMADRRKKKIKDIKVGDKILTYNLGNTKVKAVLEIKTGSSNNVRAITLKPTDGEAFTIKATEGHPFFCKERGCWAVMDPKPSDFTNAGAIHKLQVGDSLVLRQGKCAKISHIGAPTRLATFNLVIDGPGTFFVHELLSHSGLPPPTTQPAP